MKGERQIVKSGATIEELYARARAAQSEWAARPLRARLAVIRRLRHWIAAHADRLADAVRTSGQRAPGETLAAEVLPLADACRFLERRAPAILRMRHMGRGSLFSLFAGVLIDVAREPFGVEEYTMCVPSGVQQG